MSATHDDVAAVLGEPRREKLPRWATFRLPQGHVHIAYARRGIRAFVVMLTSR